MQVSSAPRMFLAFAEALASHAIASAWLIAAARHATRLLQPMPDVVVPPPPPAPPVPPPPPPPPPAVPPPPLPPVPPLPSPPEPVEPPLPPVPVDPPPPPGFDGPELGPAHATSARAANATRSLRALVCMMTSASLHEQAPFQRLFVAHGDAVLLHEAMKRHTIELP